MSEQRKDIGGRAVRGVLWTGGAQVVRQIIQIGGSITLARLLAPDDFGLIGMAMFFIGIGQMFSDFGIGSALIQNRTRTDDAEVLSTCFWLNMGVAAALAISITACSPLIAAFFGRADLAPIVTLLSLNLLLAGLTVVPQAILYRDLRFAELAYSQVGGSLVGLVSAGSMAVFGFGVWSLVIQPLAGNLATAAVLYGAVRWWPKFRYSYPRIRHLVHFSGNVLGSSLLSYAQRSADSLLIGRLLTAHAVGIYAQATQIMLLPLQQVSSVVVRVLFPALVQLQDDMPRFRRAYLKSINAIALITFPLMAGLFALAEEFVLVVLGSGWSEMIPLLKVLAWVGMMQSIATTSGTLYLGSGNARAMLRVSALVTPIIVGGITVGTYWGIEGVAIGYAIASFSTFFYSMTQAIGLVGLRWRDIAESTWRPLVCSVVMLAGVSVVHEMLVDWSLLPRFVLCIGAGAAVYLISSLYVSRAILFELMRDLRGLRSVVGERG